MSKQQVHTVLPVRIIEVIDEVPPHTSAQISNLPDNILLPISSEGSLLRPCACIEIAECMGIGYPERSVHAV